MSPQPAAKADRAAAVSYPPIRPIAPWRVAEVEALADWRLHVRHNDGTAGFVDVSRLVHSARAGVFAALRDPDVFRRVYLDLGAVTWPGEIDLSPYTMHDRIKASGEWLVE